MPIFGRAHHPPSCPCAGVKTDKPQAISRTVKDPGCAAPSPQTLAVNPADLIRAEFEAKIVFSCILHGCDFLTDSTPARVILRLPHAVFSIPRKQLQQLF
jgi:hypothetical protein